MNKAFSALLSCVIATAFTTPSVEAAISEYNSSAQLVAAQSDIANWMKYLPDDVYVAHVSIPGTHDTATAEGWSTSTGASYSTTQNQTVDEQLAGGIRAFDFRPGLNGASGTELYCNHGTDRTKLTLKDALLKLTNYLDAHPSEFFVIHLFRGNVYNNSGDASTGVKLLGGLDSDAARTNYNNLMGELFNTGDISNYIIDYSPYLKVKDIRGKIVVFRRDRISFVNLEKAGNLTNWPGDSELWSADNYVTATNATNAALRGTIYATDVSSPDDSTELETELTSITNLFKHNCEQTKPNEAKKANTSYKPAWSMIFTSGAYDGENTAGYLKNATYTNPHLTSLITEAKNNNASGPTGIVLSDWVLTSSHTYSSSTYATKGDELVTAIIENNFSYISDYILDDELFTDNSSTEDIFEGKTYFLRNIGTGMLFSCGANWGTHATLSGDGIKITPVFNSAENSYLLSTTLSNSGASTGYLTSDLFVDGSTSQSFSVVYTGNGNVFYITTDNNTKALTATYSSGWVDGTEYVVTSEDYATGNTMQQWEFITVDDFLKEQVAKANPDNAVDLSFLIAGHKFRPNDSENWTGTTNYKKAITGTIHASYIAAEGTDAWDDKELVLHCYNTSSNSTYNSNTVWSLSHSTTNLPAGKYTLSFQAAQYSLNTLDSDATLTFKVNDVSYKSLLKSVSSNTASDVVTAFRNDTNGDYTISIDLTFDGEGTITFDMSKDKTSSVTGLFLDNITLTYYGPTTLQCVEYTPQDEYDTLILPFSHDVPSGLSVYSAYDYTTKEDSYYVVGLVPRETIEANTPYIVSYTSVSRASDAEYTFWGTPVESTSTTSGILVGTLSDATAPADSYVLKRTTDGLAFVKVTSDDNVTVSANRAYIVDENLSSENSTVGTILFEVVNNQMTGIADSKIGDTIDAQTIVDVYNVAGVKMCSAMPFIDALKVLDRGIYIVRSATATMKIRK